MHLPFLFATESLGHVTAPWGSWEPEEGFPISEGVRLPPEGSDFQQGVIGPQSSLLCQSPCLAGLLVLAAPGQACPSITLVLANQPYCPQFCLLAAG